MKVFMSFFVHSANQVFFCENNQKVLTLICHVTFRNKTVYAQALSGCMTHPPAILPQQFRQQASVWITSELKEGR